MGLIWGNDNGTKLCVVAVGIYLVLFVGWFGEKKRGHLIIGNNCSHFTIRRKSVRVNSLFDYGYGSIDKYQGHDRNKRPSWCSHVEGGVQANSEFGLLQAVYNHDVGERIREMRSNTAKWIQEGDFAGVKLAKRCWVSREKGSRRVEGVCCADVFFSFREIVKRY